MKAWTTTVVWCARVYLPWAESSRVRVPASCLSTLERALADRGITLGDLRHLLLTHIHLDHAGAMPDVFAASVRDLSGFAKGLG